jgi:predicted aspartyl protease
MTTRFRVLALSLIITLVFALTTPCQQPAAAAGPGAKAEQAKSLLEQGKGAKALTVVDAGLKADPWNPDLGYFKVKALLKLGRFMDAARTALQMAAKNPTHLEFRYLAGESAYQMGMIPQAVKNWSVLFQDRDWSEPACRRAVLALKATGKEQQALKLLKETVARWDNPPVGLLRLDLNLTTDVAEGIKLSDRLIKADPSNKGEYDALKDIFKAAGSGSLFEEAPIKSLPVTIPIKEKSEYKDLSSLTWGSMDIGTDRVATTTQVVVPCSIDGSSDMPVLLDSGSDTMLVSPEWVKKLGLKPVATTEYVGLGVRGPQKSNWVLLKKVEIGPVTIKNVPAMVISENEDFFKRVGGILPLSILRHHALLYDRRHSKLVLYPSGTSPASVLGKGTYVVKSLWPYNKPFVQVSINGHHGLYCLVDTGAFATHLSLNKMEALDIKPNSGRYSSATGSGLSGSYSAPIASNVEMILGRTRFNMHTVLLANLGEGYGIDCYGLLGRRDVLDLLNMFFDYKANVIAFVPYDR